MELVNNISNNIIGGNKNNKYILVDGTSSAGKSTICKFFSTHNYICFQIDNYFSDPRINYTNLFKKMKNNYGAIDDIYENEPVKYMVDDAIKTNKNILFDHVSQKGIINYMKTKKLHKKLYIINVFTNLNDLARNLETRRKTGDMRGVFAFRQFSDRYIKCDNDDKIETINKNDFIKILLRYFKYEFRNKDDLIKFSDDVFNNMNIYDNKDYYVKLRNEYIYDYLLITTNKTKEEIFYELNDIISKKN